MWIVTVAVMVAAAAWAGWGLWRSWGTCLRRGDTVWQTARRLVWWPAGLLAVWVVLTVGLAGAPGIVTAAVTGLITVTAVGVLLVAVTAAWVGPRSRLSPLWLAPLWVAAAFYIAVATGYPSAIQGNPEAYINGTGPIIVPLIAGSWAGIIVLLVGAAHLRWLYQARATEAARAARASRTGMKKKVT